MDLLTGYTSDSSEDNEEETTTAKKEYQKMTPLPPPDVALKSRSSSSVFGNIYNSKANVEEAMLEKHVKMVENKQKISQVDGRQVCWMYRRGKCRFGKNCNMFHDSELRHNAISGTGTAEPKQPVKSSGNLQNDVEVNVSETSSLQAKKKRPGVSNSLIPPKKALKEIKRIQSIERT